MAEAPAPADHAAIATLMGAYVEAIDGGDFDALLALFAADGSLHPHGHEPYRGREAILGFITGSRRSRSGPSRWGAIRHHVSSLRVRPNGDAEATATSYFLAISALGPDHWGTYRDELVAGEGGWLFASRAVTIDGADPSGWVGSGAAPVRFEPAAGGDRA